MLLVYGEDLPWVSTAEDKTFLTYLVAALALTVTLSIVVPLINLPPIPRSVEERLPPQFAEIVLPPAEVKPVVPPVVEAPPEEIVPVEEEAPVPEEIPIPEVKPQTVQQAREKAKFSGLLAFRDDFAELRQSVDVSKLKATTAIAQGAGVAEQIDRSLLTSKGGREIASVNTSALSRETGGVALASYETTVVEAPPEEEGQAVGARRTSARTQEATRSIEQVRRVFDANKGAIYAIYNRALRENPGLAGKVVLELEIDPQGQVTNCTVVSSEIDDEEMLAKLVRRVQLFNFGTGEVAVTRINYPVHFLPS